jgi:excisionase family DNA binding protein
MEINRLCCGKVLLSRGEFSTLTGLSLRTISKLVASRELHSIRVGRRRLIPKSALLRFVQRDHSTQSAPRKKVGR